ncbi:hypothetical protein [Neptuniibacter sp.]|uniref:hypothetical protein n=1 Tax=Neptuniibacter sp. TaxID=1962643 RepID=UPI002633C601|nr:hypothetical protein [Neptuniibacter sp.]MCP4595265.1 hypothetical protein [Neptuniibacter sp.]
MKRFFTIFALLMTLFGTTQMSVAAALPMEHMSSDMNSMVEMGGDMHSAVDCADQPGCELQSSCGGHLCSAISSVTSLDIAYPPFTKPIYKATLMSLYLTQKDRPPQVLMS